MDHPVYPSTFYCIIDVGKLVIKTVMVALQRRAIEVIITLLRMHLVLTVGTNKRFRKRF